MKFISAQTPVPRTIITMKRAHRPSWLGGAPLSVGIYCVQGNLAKHIRSIHERRCVKMGVYTLQYLKADEETDTQVTSVRTTGFGVAPGGYVGYGDIADTKALIDDAGPVVHVTAPTVGPTPAAKEGPSIQADLGENTGVVPDAGAEETPTDPAVPTGADQPPAEEQINEDEPDAKDPGPAHGAEEGSVTNEDGSPVVERTGLHEAVQAGSEEQAEDESDVSLTTDEPDTERTDQ